MLHPYAQAFSKTRVVTADKEVHRERVIQDDALVDHQVVATDMADLGIHFVNAARKIIAATGLQHLIHHFKLGRPLHVKTIGLKDVGVWPVVALTGAERLQLAEVMQGVKAGLIGFADNRYADTKQTSMQRDAYRLHKHFALAVGASPEDINLIVV